LFAYLGRNLFGQSVEEGPEDLGVTVGDDEADELAAGGFDRSDDVASQVPSIVALRGTAAALDPAVARARVAFETGFVAEKDAGGRIG
jgi:hypothetical protein